MTNAALIALTWIALAVHMGAGVVVQRRLTTLPLLPVLNGVTALCVLGYWLPKWYGYIAKGITWYATDQLVPLYALAVCVLAICSLAGRYNGTALNWSVLGLHTLVLLGAAVFFTFFRMQRLF